MTRFLLVRHGQSEWNALGRWQGQADPPLSDLGRRQALLAADRLGTVDVIVSSPLQRALHTAQILSEALGVGPVVVEEDLEERDAGEWSGLTSAEIDERWPGWRDERRRPPGWEPDDALLERAIAALGRIEAEYGDGEALVLTHGGLVYAIEAHHGEPFERLPNLGARWVTHHGDRVEIGERLLLVDDAHVTTVPAQI